MEKKEDQRERLDVERMDLVNPIGVKHEHWVSKQKDKQEYDI